MMAGFGWKTLALLQDIHYVLQRVCIFVASRLQVANRLVDGLGLALSVEPEGLHVLGLRVDLLRLPFKLLRLLLELLRLGHVSGREGVVFLVFSTSAVLSPWICVACPSI